METSWKHHRGHWFRQPSHLRRFHRRKSDARDASCGTTARERGGSARGGSVGAPGVM
jgi:hypothetical protein